MENERVRGRGDDEVGMFCGGGDKVGSMTLGEDDETVGLCRYVQTSSTRFIT